MKTVAILQPAYLPWLGYFEQLHRADVFVTYDDVLYNKHSWRNRNRIKGAGGAQWLTVPVLTHGLGPQLVKDVAIDARSPWQRKHFASLRQAYARAPYVEWVLERLQPIYTRPWRYLVDVDLALHEVLGELLRITRPLVRSSTLPLAGDRIERLIALCQQVGATRFYEGQAGTDYLDPHAFAEQGIELIFQNYRHPVYRQLHGAFVSHLSVVDLLFNHGPDSADIVVQSRQSDEADAG